MFQVVIDYGKLVCWCIYHRGLTNVYDLGKACLHDSCFVYPMILILLKAYHQGHQGPHGAHTSSTEQLYCSLAKHLRPASSFSELNEVIPQGFEMCYRLQELPMAEY